SAVALASLHSFPTRRSSDLAPMLEEFKKFVLRGNVVDLAVGVVIGVAFGAIVASLVGDIIMPIIGAATGGLDFSNYYLSLSDKRSEEHTSELQSQSNLVCRL